MNLTLLKAKGCPELDKETLRLFVKFMKYAAKELNLEDKPIKIRFLGKSPNESITTGAYQPDNKTISTIVAGRHPIDYFRTIAHEMTHMQQDYNGELNEPYQEIGGDIEDAANIHSGRITKFYIKNILTKEDKARLGLGTYGV
jgi:hypothetical protein